MAAANVKRALNLILRYPDFHMGPTIPFLLGALEVPIATGALGELVSKQKLKSLVDDLATGKEVPGLRIVWCEARRAHVVTDHLLRGGLDWEPIDGCVPPDYEGLVAVLWSRDGMPILRGDYSLDQDQGDWRPFNGEEIQEIRRALAD